MSFGALAFLNPWLLGALVTLPIIYWLLRTVPPRPRQLTFPPTRILAGIENQEKTPAKSPWWLTLIRLLAAALIIFAFAEPVMNPSREATLKGSGPVVIVVDNGWASAPHWTERARMIERTIGDAEALGRPIVILPTASTAKTVAAKIEAPSDARSSAAAIEPQPFAPDRLAALSALDATLRHSTDAAASIVWLSDGIDHDGKTDEVLERLQRLAEGGTFAVVEGRRGNEALGVTAGIGQNSKLDAIVLRADGGPREGFIHAYSARGQRLGETPFRLGYGERSTSVALELPLELRNQVSRVEIAGEKSAGAVSLLDARSQWQRVALISGEAREEAQPLLAPLYYIDRALR
ncbi:MAG: BatA domain-containing protein, partial [Hyphomicrobium sp.]